MVSAFLLSMFLVVAVAHFVILHSFEELEEHYHKQNILRVTNYIREDLSELESQVIDWAEWDDSYHFIIGTDPVYAESNLNKNTLLNLDLNLMLYLNMEGGLEGQLFMQSGKDDLDSISEELLHTLFAEGYYISDVRSTEGKSGFIHFNDDLMMLYSWPILTSDSEGPARGTLIMGRIIDDEYIAFLREKMEMDLSLISFPDKIQFRNLINTQYSSEEKEAVVQGRLTATKGKHAGHILLRNSSDEPVSIIRVDLSRDIFLYGRRTVVNFLLLFTCIMLITVTVTTVFLDRSVTLRISEMQESLEAISQRADLWGRVEERGSDEITSLSKSINNMIGTLARVLENIPDPLLLSENNGKILLTNEAGQTVTGYSQNELVSLMMGKLTGRFYAEDYNNFWRDLVERSSLTFEATVVRRDGSNFPVEFHSTLFSLGERMFALSVIRDISRRKQYEIEMTEKALYEPLTGLPNRYLFNDRLAMAFERYNRNRDSSFALVMIDLDNFKEINDTLGHLVGDVFLSEFATRLTEVTRSEDSLSRWGGDEFTLIVEKVSTKKELETFIRRLRKVAEVPIFLNEKEYSLSFSVGIALKTDGIHLPEEMICRADKALYQAKRTREAKVSVVFFSDLM